MNTLMRLLILIPATAFAILMAWIGIGFAGLGLWSVAFHLAVAAIPAWLLVWTIRDHFVRKRNANRRGAVR